MLEDNWYWGDEKDETMGHIYSSQNLHQAGVIMSSIFYRGLELVDGTTRRRTWFRVISTRVHPLHERTTLAWVGRLRIFGSSDGVNQPTRVDRCQMSAMTALDHERSRQIKSVKLQGPWK